jgi:hypothetical protein
MLPIYKLSFLMQAPFGVIILRSSATRWPGPTIVEVQDFAGHADAQCVCCEPGRANMCVYVCVCVRTCVCARVR